MAKKKKAKLGWKWQILVIVMGIASVMFSAVTIIAVVGMIPTVVAWIVDRSPGKLKAMTVGSINFAGCTPFMIEVFKNGNSLETAINYIVEPRTIVVMYFAAAMGYMIDWALTGIIAAIMVQKTKSRLEDIEKNKKELVDRWGIEVTGTVPLDEYGYARQSEDANAEAQPAS